MVNTFCVSKDVDVCAKALDWRRLGKQRVEAKQIYDVVTGVKTGWRNHPACKMWMGYPDALAIYCNAMISEWIRRGYKNNMPMLPTSKPVDEVEFPAWFGWSPVVFSHMASLNRKDPVFYTFDIPEEYARLGYVWPSALPPDTWGSAATDPKLLCAPITISRPKQPPMKRAKTVAVIVRV
jgi:hypothetical protein